MAHSVAVCRLRAYTGMSAFELKQDTTQTYPGWCTWLQILLGTFAGDMIGLPDRQSDYSQSRVFATAGSELTTVRDKQILDVVGLSPLVAHAIARLLAHAAGSHVMRRGVGRHRDGLSGADRIVDIGAAFEGIVAHREIVRMIVVMHVWNRQTPFVFLSRIEGDGVGLLRHVL